MKALKIVFFSILGLVAVVLITTIFLKSEYHVFRSITINKPKTEVFEYAKYLKNQNEYSVWATTDPNMKKEFRGTDGQPGFVSAWDSEVDDVGKGEQEIIKITDGQRIDYELRFIEPFESKDMAYMTFEAVSDSSTQVKWGFDGKMVYPMNIMLLFMDFDAMLGKDLQEGLSKLKVVLEVQ
ncbi:MAG: SRPBCC family protein [Bacteroidales bacterium]